MGGFKTETLRRWSVFGLKVPLAPLLLMTLAACSSGAKEQATCAGLVGWEDEAKPLPSPGIEVAHVSNQKAVAKVGDDVSCTADTTSYTGSSQTISYTMKWDKFFKMYSAKPSPEDEGFLAASAQVRYEKGQQEMVERMLKEHQ